MLTSYDGWPAADFDLGPWITAGRLAWVAPGDPTVHLERTASTCPYLGLPGDHRFQRLQMGRAF